MIHSLKSLSISVPTLNRQVLVAFQVKPLDFVKGGAEPNRVEAAV